MLFSFVLSGECSLGAHGLLRFRTDDVLLWHFGRRYVCVPSVMCYGYGPPVRRYRSTNLSGRPVAPRWSSGLRFEIGELTLIFFHT